MRALLWLAMVGFCTAACTLFDTSELTRGTLPILDFDDAGAGSDSGYLLGRDGGSARDARSPIGSTDAGVSDGSVQTPVSDAASLDYCVGWKFCDTFEPGTPHMPWTAYATGGNQVDPSLKEEVAPETGSTALRASRKAGVDAFFRQFQDKSITECEADVYVVDTFDSNPANKPELVVAYFELLGAGANHNPMAAFFRKEGFFGRKQGNGGDLVTPTFVEAKTRNVWLHLGLKLALDGARSVVGSSISMTAPGKAMDTKSIPIGATPYESVRLNVGLACDVYGATPKIDVYVDNVRCR